MLRRSWNILGISESWEALILPSLQEHPHLPAGVGGAPGIPQWIIPKYWMGLALCVSSLGGFSPCLPFPCPCRAPAAEPSCVSRETCWCHLSVTLLVPSVSPSSWQWPLGHRVWNKIGIFFSPLQSSRGGMEMGLLQRFSVVDEKCGVLGAKKIESPRIPVAKAPLLSHNIVLEFRLEIGIVPGLRNPPGFPTLSVPLHLGQVGQGWGWGGRGWSWELCSVLVTTPWISCLLASRSLHKILHVPTK